MALSKDSILKHAGVFDTKTVHVPAWADEHGDDEVIVRGMTVREFELHQANLARSGKEAQGKATASLVARCVVDAQGRRVFSEADVDAIAELGFGEINRLGLAITELSGLGDEAAAEISGNSEAAQSGSSGSSLPETSSIAPSPNLRTA